MRIISGKFKGKKLFSPNNKQIRPTSDRGKETIFSTLNSILLKEKKKFSEIKVLDCFCGTGALGIECISRGSDDVYFIDSSQIAIDLTKKNCLLINKKQNLNFLKLDLTDFKIDPIYANLFFLDPPYKKIDVKKVLKLLDINKSIIQKSIGIVELPYEENFNDFHGFEILKKKKVSNSNFIFVKKK